MPCIPRRNVNETSIPVEIRRTIWCDARAIPETLSFATPTTLYQIAVTHFADRIEQLMIVLCSERQVLQATLIAATSNSFPS